MLESLAFSQFDAACDALRVLGAPPRLLADADAVYAAYDTHLDWSGNRALRTLIEPAQPWWVLHLTERDRSTGLLEESLAEVSQGPEGALGRTMEALDEGVIAVDELEWLDCGGWELRYRGSRVALAQPLQFTPVDAELLRRCQGVFRGLLESDLDRAEARLRELPGLRHVVPSKGNNPMERYTPVHPTPVRVFPRMLAFEPGLAVRRFCAFAAEFGLQLSPGQARQALAGMWGFADWHHVVAKWKSLAGCDPYIVHDRDTTIGIAPDAASAMALLSQEAVRRGQAWCEQHWLDVATVSGRPLVGLVKRDMELWTSDGLPVPNGPTLSAGSIDETSFARAFYEEEAKQAWGSDPQRRRQEVSRALGLGLTPLQRLERAAQRQEMPRTLRYRNFFLARTEDSFGDSSKFRIVALDDELQGVAAPAVFGDQNRGVYCALESLYKTNLHYHGGTFEVRSDYGRDLAWRLDGVSPEDATRLAKFFGRGLHPYGV